jgi:DNA-binding CsgD family transcriptional regulator
MASDTRIQLFVQFSEPGPLGQVGVEERLARQRERLEELGRRPDVVDARPLFTRPAATLLDEQRTLEGAGTAPLPDLTRWIRVRGRDADAAAALATELAERPGVAGVTRPTYLGRDGTWHRLKQRGLRVGKSAAAPLHRRAVRRLEREASSASRDGAAARESRDLSMNQRYLLSAPWGLGVVDVPGWPRVNEVGDVRIGVIDDYWNKEHVDLCDVRVAAETGVCHQILDHGTNAVGILLASAKNPKGIVGLAGGAQLVFAYPYVRDAAGNVLYSVADAINRASELLRPGDVLLLERQIAFKAVELSQVCHDAIRHAVAKGIVVVEPAGNGGLDLDDPQVNGGVDLLERHSGAIVVGAGLEASPQRLSLSHAAADKSCYGRRVDVQGFGVNVLTTTGAGRVGKMMRRLLGRAPASGESGAGGGKPEEAFTDGFNGTSAASAIVAGGIAVACSVARALDPKGEPLSPATLRELVIRTGSPQSLADAYSRDRHVGPQPDVPALLRGVREALYARHHVPSPRGPRPSLTPDEHRLVRLVASGLAETDLAELMAEAESAVRRLWSQAAAKLEAETPLAMARAADHWSLL